LECPQILNRVTPIDAGAFRDPIERWPAQSVIVGVIR
jgi:hypothetical protein